MTERTYLDVDRVERPSEKAEKARQVEEMPTEKKAELYASATVFVSRCAECGEKTWLIGTPTYNTESECHNCGEKYRM